MGPCLGPGVRGLRFGGRAAGWVDGPQFGFAVVEGTAGRREPVGASGELGIRAFGPRGMVVDTSFDSSPALTMRASFPCPAAVHAPGRSSVQFTAEFRAARAASNSRAGSVGDWPAMPVPYPAGVLLAHGSLADSGGELLGSGLAAIGAGTGACSWLRRREVQRGSLRWRRGLSAGR